MEQWKHTSGQDVGYRTEEHDRLHDESFEQLYNIIAYRVVQAKPLGEAPVTQVSGNWQQCQEQLVSLRKKF